MNIRFLLFIMSHIENLSLCLLSRLACKEKMLTCPTDTEDTEDAPRLDQKHLEDMLMVLFTYLNNPFHDTSHLENLNKRNRFPITVETLPRKFLCILDINGS